MLDLVEEDNMFVSKREDITEAFMGVELQMHRRSNRLAGKGKKKKDSLLSSQSWTLVQGI